MENRQIQLEEAHLSYVWCIGYMFIKLKDIVDKQSLEGKRITILSRDTEGHDEINDLLQWAFDLIKSYSGEWPKHLPNPLTESEAAMQANGLFLHTIRYLMYHEVAHLANNHGEYAKLVNCIKFENYEPTNDEKDSLSSVEVESDNYAWDCLFLGDDQEDMVYMKSLGAIVAHFSSLYLLESSGSLIQSRYPDWDVRVFNQLNRTHFDGEAPKIFIGLTYNIGISIFLRIHNIDYKLNETEADKYETFDEVITYLFGKIDEEKSNWLNYTENEC